MVPYAPAGTADIVARMLAEKLGRGARRTFYVENTPGAGGTIGMGAVASAPGDGNTLLIANQDLIVQPIIKAKVPYDPLTSFAPITLVVTAPEMIVVHPSMPVKDVKELIALLKAKPGKYSYASPGYGTTPHLACEWLFRVDNGIEITHVPFQGAAPATQSALLAARRRCFTTCFRRSRRTSGPARCARSRWPPASVRRTSRTCRPSAKPASPATRSASGSGVFAVSRERRSRWSISLNSQITRIMNLPDIKERFATIGFDPTLSTRAELSAHMKAETDKWSKVVREANIKIE